MKAEKLDLTRHLAAIAKLQEDLTPEHEHRSGDLLRHDFTDLARRGGDNVVVAIADDGAVDGVAAWVDIAVAQGDFYGAPIWARSADSAKLLVDRVVREAQGAGAEWIQVGGWETEGVKRRALTEAGFAPLFDFVDLLLPLAEGADAVEGGAITLADLEEVAISEVDLDAFAQLHNECFRDVPCAPSMGSEESGAILASRAWLAGSGIWREPGAAGLLGFLLVEESGYVDSIATHPSVQRRGLARAMLDRVRRSAPAAGVERLWARIAESNRASLGLATNLGFREIARRQQFQLQLQP